MVVPLSIRAVSQWTQCEEALPNPILPMAQTHFECRRVGGQGHLVLVAVWRYTVITGLK